MDRLLRRTLLHLLEIEAIKFGSFRLKLHEKHPDAPLSPIYVDLRTVRSYPFVLRNVVVLLGKVVLTLKPDYVADVPTAATPIVGAIAATFDIPMVSPRMELKTHGTKGSIDGSLEPGANVVVVDDLITRADSKIKAVSILRHAGAFVKDIVVFLDREQGGAEQLAHDGCQLHALTSLREMLRVYVEDGLIGGSVEKRVLAYLGEEAV